MENGRKTKGPKGAKKTKKEDGKQRDVEHATEDQEAEVRRMGEDDHGNSNCERDGKQGEDEGNIWVRDGKRSAHENGKSTWQNDGKCGVEERSSRKHELNKMKADMIFKPTSSGNKSHIPVDPILLQGFPTNGPNDSVPPGFTPVSFMPTVGILQEATSIDNQTLVKQDGKWQPRTWPSTMTPVQTRANKRAKETEDEYVLCFSLGCHF